MNRTLILLGLLIFTLSACQKKNVEVLKKESTQVYHISPSTTDPNITEYTLKHHIYINNQVPMMGKLLIFFPGTGGTPKHYFNILKEAAAMGYHVIGLNYPNNYEIYFSCFFNKDSSCYEQYRTEKFNGANKAKALNVDYTHSIQNRLIKLLDYLHKQYPAQNWHQFLENNDVAWSKCVVAGHSQGGGHAAFIGKKKEVDRVVIFSSIDWIISKKASADWVFKTGATPNDRVYAFIHTKDEYFKYKNVIKQWSDYQLDSLGAPVDIDKTKPPFNHSHTLITTAKPHLNILNAYHLMTCVDKFIPKDNKGEVAQEFKDAWAYLLGQKEATPHSSLTVDSNNIKIE
jgi:predicted esterase